MRILSTTDIGWIGQDVSNRQKTRFLGWGLVSSSPGRLYYDGVTFTRKLGLIPLQSSEHPPGKTPIGHALPRLRA